MVTFSFKNISIKHTTLLDSRQWRIKGAAGRCRQIRIWLYRAGRARSQKREMKFDRSDRETLSLSVPLSPLTIPPCRPHLRPSRSSHHPATSRAAKWRWHTRPPGFRTFGVPHGHRRTPPSLAHVTPPLHLAFSRRTLFYTILFYLLPPCRCRHRRRLCSLGGIRWSGSP